MQPDETFEHLKGRLVKILNQRKTDIYDDNIATEITAESVRLWKSQPLYTKTEKMVDFIKVNDLDQEIIKEKIKNSNESEGDIEENSGVDFPGLQFDSFLQKTYREVDKTSTSIHINYDLIVVEIAAIDGKFIFRFNKNPGVYGKCENCFQTGILRSMCACKKVAYCSDSCLVKDEKYHM